MKIKVKENGRVFITNKINESFIDALKAEAKNPFSLTALASDINIGVEFEFFIPNETNCSITERMEAQNEKVDHLLRNVSLFNKFIEVVPDTFEDNKDLNVAYLEKDMSLKEENGEGFEFVSFILFHQ